MTLKTLLLTASATLAISATSAAASPFDSASLTYGHDTMDYGDSSEADMSWARVDLGFDVFGLDGDFAMTQGALGEDNQTTALSFALGKDFDGTTFGVFYDVPLIEGEDQDVRHYGATIGFEFAGLDLDGYAGRGDFDFDQSRVFGASVHGDLGAGLDAGVFYNYEGFDAEDVVVSERGVSLGYTISALPLEMYVNAYVSQTSVDFDFLEQDVKRLGFTVSVPLQADGTTEKGRLRPYEHSTLYSEFGYGEANMMR